jgi:hypothetical protein
MNAVCAAPHDACYPELAIKIVSYVASAFAKGFGATNLIASAT